MRTSPVHPPLPAERHTEPPIIGVIAGPAPSFHFLNSISKYTCLSSDSDCTAVRSAYDSERFMRPESGTPTVRIISSPAITKILRDACADNSLEWTEGEPDSSSFGFGGTISETTVLVGALSAVATGLCAVLRTALKERKRVVTIESKGKKFRFENFDEKEILAILSGATHSVDVRVT